MKVLSLVNSPETDPRAQRARVLLVDDDQAFLTALTDCLRYRFPNMAIETACRVDAALLLVAAITYDAIHQ